MPDDQGSLRCHEVCDRGTGNDPFAGCSMEIDSSGGTLPQTLTVAWNKLGLIN